MQGLIKKPLKIWFGNFVRQRIDSYLGSYAVRMDMDKAVRDELKNKVVQVVLKDCEIDE